MVVLRLMQCPYCLEWGPQNVIEAHLLIDPECKEKHYEEFKRLNKNKKRKVLHG